MGTPLLGVPYLVGNSEVIISKFPASNIGLDAGVFVVLNSNEKIERFNSDTHSYLKATLGISGAKDFAKQAVTAEAFEIYVRFADSSVEVGDFLYLSGDGRATTNETIQQIGYALTSDIRKCYDPVLETDIENCILIKLHNSILNKSNIVTPNFSIGCIFSTEFEITSSKVLKCDGATYNSSDYPEYVNKRGIIKPTFDVPDLRMKVLVHTDSEQKINTYGNDSVAMLDNINIAMDYATEDQSSLIASFARRNDRPLSIVNIFSDDSVYSICNDDCVPNGPYSLNTTLYYTSSAYKITLNAEALVSIPELKPSTFVPRSGDYTEMRNYKVYQYIVVKS